MQLNLPKLFLTAGLSLSIISAVSDAEAGITTKRVIMSKQQPEKFAASVTPETIRQDKTFVRAEEELTEKLLEAIAGRSSGGGWGGNHNETIVSVAEHNS